MQGLEGDIENRDLLISNGILVAVPHEAARMNKVGEGHTALRWRIARGCRHAPDSTRTRRRQCVLARDYNAQYNKHNAYHGIIRSLIGV